MHGSVQGQLQDRKEQRKAGTTAELKRNVWPVWTSWVLLRSRGGWQGSWLPVTDVLTSEMECETLSIGCISVYKMPEECERAEITWYVADGSEDR